jgi:flagellar biosynthesis protein FlhG
MTDEIRREDWEVLGVEPGASLEKVHRAYQSRRGLFSEDSLATYSLLGTAARRELLDQIEEAFLRISRAAADLSRDASHEVNRRDELDPAISGLGIPADPVTQPGAYLRHNRLVSGLTHEQVSVETKIRPNLLVDIEQENWQKLPAAVFVRGFVIQVARLLAVDDPDALAAAYLSKMNDQRARD